MSAGIVPIKQSHSKEMNKMNPFGDILRTEKLILKFAGFHKNNQSPISNIYLLIFSCLVITQMFSMFLQFFVTSESYIVVNTLTTFLGQIATLSKLYDFRLNWEKFHKIEEYINGIRYTEKQSVLVERKIKNFKRTMRAFYGSFFSVVLLATLNPLLERTATFPMPGYIPKTWIENYYIPLYIYEVVVMYISCLTCVAYDVMVNTLMVIGRLQFECLGAELESSFDRDSTRIKKNFKECVNAQNGIYNYLDGVEDFVTKGIFAVFLAVGSTLCITTLHLSIISIFSSLFVELLFYAIAVGYQCYVYCWYGNELYLQSVNIFWAAYKAEWYNANPKDQKLLTILITRAYRPRLMRAGKLFAINLETFMKIVQSSYSYFTVAKSLYHDE